MKPGMKLTMGLLVGVTYLLLTYEGWTLANKEDDDTISESVWFIAGRLLVIRFLAGFLFAHLMFQRGDDAQDTVLWRFIRRWPSVATHAGLICGYLFWQRSRALSTVKKD